MAILFQRVANTEQLVLHADIRLTRVVSDLPLFWTKPCQIALMKRRESDSG